MSIIKHITNKVVLLAVTAVSLISFIPAAGASAATCVHDLDWTTTQKFTPGSFCSTDNNGGEVVYQTDGNLVWYVNGKAAWNSSTMAHGSSPASTSLNFQSDSNIVIRSKSGVLWASSYLGGWKSMSAATNKQLSTYYTGGKHYFAHNVNGRDNWSMVK